MASQEMAADPKRPDNLNTDESKDAQVTIWDTESDISKNPKRISWFVIYASALANFSDGYQNNLVSSFLSAPPDLTRYA